MSQSRFFFRSIFVVDVVLVCCGGLVAAEFVRFGTFNALFSLSHEWTIPATWSGLKLALLGLLVWTVAMGTSTAQERRGGFASAILILFLAFDELGGIHERGQNVIEAMMNRVGISDPATDGVSWKGLLYAVLTVPPILFLAYWSSSFWRGFGRYRTLLLLGVVLFAIGAVMVDNVGGTVLASSALQNVLEEGLEFVGLTVAIGAALAALREHPVQLTIGDGFVGASVPLSVAATIPGAESDPTPGRSRRRMTARPRRSMGETLARSTDCDLVDGDPVMNAPHGVRHSSTTPHHPGPD